MKHSDFSISGLILLMALFFTSCLDDNDDTRSPTSSATIVTVQEYLGTVYQLVDDFGNTFEISGNKTGVNLVGMRRAYVRFNFLDNNELVNNQNTFHVELTYAVSLDGKTVYARRGEDNDSLQAKYYDPILGFDKVYTGENNDTVMGRKGYLTAAVSYYFGEQIHDFVLYSYQEDPVLEGKAAPDTVNIYFGHNSKGDQGKLNMSEMVRYSNVAPNYYYKSFGINGAIPDGYDKDTLVMRLNYRKLDSKGDTVNASLLVHYLNK